MSATTRIIGHRGYLARFPGNTLAGFAAALGHVDGFELDVRRSSDGKLVLAHDPELGNLVVSATPWETLAEVDVGGGHKPALLDEALASIDVPAQIEIKNDAAGPGYEPDHRLGLEAAERARPGDVITSFNWATVARVREVFPDVATGIILTSHHDLENAYQHCLEMGHSTLVAHHELIRTSVVDLEAEVTPWTVNDLEEAKRLASLGVSGIITDNPLSLSEIRSQ